MSIKNFSICIIGKDKETFHPECIDYASKVGHQIIYIDLGSRDRSKSKALESGTCTASSVSLESTLESEWVLFIRPDERLVLTSGKKLEKIINKYLNSRNNSPTKEIGAYQIWVLLNLIIYFKNQKRRYKK